MHMFLFASEKQEIIVLTYNQQIFLRDTQWEIGSAHLGSKGILSIRRVHVLSTLVYL